MKKVLFLSILSLALVSCNGENDGRIERLFYENIVLTLPTENSGANVLVENGNKTAIQFSYKHPDEENVADDELIELFWIEIPATTMEFNISTSNDVSNSGIEMFYVRSCFCYFEQPVTLLKKEVIGQKISANQWQVSFDIVAELNGSEYPLKDSGTYVLSTFEN